jgi:phage repressor protein C with HTH and peptisase S24 domain
MSASGVHAIIGTSPQAFSSDNRDCDSRRSVSNAGMASRGITQQPEAAEIFHKLDDLGLKQRDLARALGLEENKISKTRGGERQFKAGEVAKARDWLTKMEQNRAAGIRAVEPDLPVLPNSAAYVPIDIMPTYAGMGGGGTGEGEVERALIPRYLVESVFRGRPSDFVVIRTRGDSMEPDFRHDDELLVDKRDTSPIQPGPFAVWDADDEAYVVKNVEKLAGGRFRIFSTNAKYTPTEVSREETHIIGRPVWYGRRL